MAGGSGLTRGVVLLTHRSIETMRPGDVPYRVKDQRCFGLAVRVAPSGVKTWDLAFRYEALQNPTCLVGTRIRRYPGSCSRTGWSAHARRTDGARFD